MHEISLLLLKFSDQEWGTNEGTFSCKICNIISKFRIFKTVSYFACLSILYFSYIHINTTHVVGQLIVAHNKHAHIVVCNVARISNGQFFFVVVVAFEALEVLATQISEFN
jgi:hypothetical protein